MKTTVNTQEPFTATIEAAVLVLLAQLRQDFYKDKSLQYVLEECLVTGAKALRRSKEYSQETKNNRAFADALKANPAIALDPKALASLMVKYRIGAASTKPAEVEAAESEVEAAKAVA